MVNRTNIKSTEDRAIDVAAACILVSREYRRIMFMALFLAWLSMGFYIAFRLTATAQLVQLEAKVNSLEGKCDAIK